MSNIIIDSYFRQIEYLRISVTDRCNLKCIYCSPQGSINHFENNEVLTAAEILRFVKVAHKYGLSKVRLTGGEPLLRSDLMELISGIRDIGIKDISITTNGLMLSDMAEILRSSGLRRINISLDTLRPDRFRSITGSGDIARVWSAIEKAELSGIYPIKINVVPIRGINDDEVLDFARLTYENDFHIRFIELMPVGNGKGWKHEKCVKKDELIENISKLGGLELLEFRGKGPSRNYRLKGARGVIGFISPVSDCFCDYCNRLRLTANGKLRPCLFSDTEIDIRTPLREGISDEGLEEIYRYAVSIKPERHRMSEGHTPEFSSMSKIGG